MSALLTLGENGIQVPHSTGIARPCLPAFSILNAVCSREASPRLDSRYADYHSTALYASWTGT